MYVPILQKLMYTVPSNIRRWCIGAADGKEGTAMVSNVSQSPCSALKNITVVCN